MLSGTRSQRVPYKHFNFNQEAQMIVHRYLLTRPFSSRTVPKDFIESTGRLLYGWSHYTFGSICWANQLTDTQIEQFNLKYIGPEELKDDE
jgi:hypothetical protein